MTSITATWSIHTPFHHRASSAAPLLGLQIPLGLLPWCSSNNFPKTVYPDSIISSHSSALSLWDQFLAGLSQVQQGWLSSEPCRENLPLTFFSFRAAFIPWLVAPSSHHSSSCSVHISHYWLWMLPCPAKRWDYHCVTAFRVWEFGCGTVLVGIEVGNNRHYCFSMLLISRILKCS